jgi:hypothetical protein
MVPAEMSNVLDDDKKQQILTKLRLNPTSDGVSAGGSASLVRFSYRRATRGLAVPARHIVTVSYTFSACKHG